jgi:drug/metabolite transporter (DMT)-like permease
MKAVSADPIISPRMSGALATCVAVIMFSLTGALVAALPASGAISMLLISAGAGVALIVWSLCGQEDRSNVPVALVAWLTVLNLAQGGLYYISLKLAPTGPAAALHLATPVILMLWAIGRGHRQTGPRELATLALLAIGLLLAALTASQENTEHSSAEMALGLSLSFLSAVAVAVTFLAVAGHATRMSLQLCNGIKSLAGAALLTPVLLTSPLPQLGVTVGLLAAGAFACAPGLALCWYAIARAPATTVASIGLFEAALTPAIAGAVLGVASHSREWLIVIPVIAAALLEVRRPQPPPASGVDFRSRSTG